MIPFYYALPWAAPFLLALPASRRKPNLADVPAATDGLVSVIIPARNEAGTIETVLTSVQASEYPELEIVVVNDRSTDQTAAIVSRLARTDSRIRLIEGAELPPGWYGKPWACAQGAGTAQGRHLVFTDADTRHAPTLIGRSVGALLSERPGLVTIAPKQLCLTFWERVVMPQIWLLLAVRYHPRRVNGATRSRDVIANGQFILMSREVYDIIGTHAAVRGEVAEDLALAQRAQQLGHRVWFAFAESLMETRMYDGLAPMIEGWSKNLYLGGRQSFPGQPVLQALVPLMLASAMLYWLLPPLALLLALTAWPALIGAALVATVMCTLFWAGTMDIMQIPKRYALAFPAGSAMGLLIVARSVWRGGRRVEWKGRTYAEATRGKPAARTDR